MPTSLKPTVSNKGQFSQTPSKTQGKLLVLYSKSSAIKQPSDKIALAIKAKRQPALSATKYTGFPSYQTQRLGSLKGYTEVESVNLSGIPANDSELSEIESLLKGGVYL